VCPLHHVSPLRERGIEVGRGRGRKGREEEVGGGK
jgi:hypothetical protein